MERHFGQKSKRYYEWSKFIIEVRDFIMTAQKCYERSKFYYERSIHIEKGQYFIMNGQDFYDDR